MRRLADELWNRGQAVGYVSFLSALVHHGVIEEGLTSVYPTTGTWHAWWTNATHPGGQTVTRAVDLAKMPIFVRAGAIIPLVPVRQYTSHVVEVIHEPH